MTGDTASFDDFIRQRQGGVLQRGIESLEGAAPEDLRATVHRIRGTLGSFALPGTAEALEPLGALLRADPPDHAAIEEARAGALAMLRETAHSLGDAGGAGGTTVE